MTHVTHITNKIKRKKSKSINKLDLTSHAFTPSKTRRLQCG